MTTPTKLIKKTRNVEANFTIPETVASWFLNNPTVKLIQMLQLQIKFGEVQKTISKYIFTTFFSTIPQMVSTHHSFYLDKELNSSDLLYS